MLWKTLFAAAVALGLALGPASDARADEFRLLKRDGTHLKWGTGEFGSGAEISYRIVDRPAAFPDGINCPLLESVAGLLERGGLRDADFAAEVRAAFSLWERAAGVRFVEAADMSAADLLIGAQQLPRGIAFTGLRYESGDAGPAVARITKAAICLNPRLVWETAQDGSIETYSVRRVLAHEIGHVIGLDHPGPRGQIMGYSYSEGPTVLHQGDIDGALQLYGPPSRR